jgi:hypothetical protein
MLSPPDVLASPGVPHSGVPRLVDVLQKHPPDVVLMMAGANGFDAVAQDQLIRTICEISAAQLFVATILPQKAGGEAHHDRGHARSAQGRTFIARGRLSRR